MWNKLTKLLSNWYFQYELVTCIYLFEPWEKMFINGLLVLILSLVTYSTYVYLPHYTISLLRHLNVDATTTEKLVIDYKGYSRSATTSQM